jgi:TonB family protein
VAVPSASVNDAIRGAIRGGASNGIGEGINIPATPGRPGANLEVPELLSDPQGVDFRPYLIKVLAAVRRNWWAVWPEAARLGRQGRVGIQFSIARNGGIPKLVIVSASGTLALDRAAVSGISASNPFPALPSEYKGEQIVLQLNFAYNVK